MSHGGQRPGCAPRRDATLSSFNSFLNVYNVSTVCIQKRFSVHCFSVEKVRILERIPLNVRSNRSTLSTTDLSQPLRAFRSRTQTDKRRKERECVFPTRSCGVCKHAYTQKTVCKPIDDAMWLASRRIVSPRDSP